MEKMICRVSWSIWGEASDLVNQDAADVLELIYQNTVAGVPHEVLLPEGTKIVERPYGRNIFLPDGRKFFLRVHHSLSQWNVLTTFQS